MRTTFTTCMKTLIPDLAAVGIGVLEKAKQKNGGYFTVTIENVKKPRTTGIHSQNHHLNGHIQQICEETGNSFEVVKEEVKIRAVKQGYPMLERGGGPVVDMFGRVRGISERDCSTEECALLIEEAHMLAAEMNVILQED